MGIFISLEGEVLDCFPAICIQLPGLNPDTLNYQNLY